MDAKTPTAGVILAAGMSRRFGQPKQLTKIGGRTLVEITVEAALGSKLDHVVVVLGFAMDAVMQVLARHRQYPFLNIIENKDFRNGMAGSIHHGLKAVAHDYSSVMFILGDQPLIRIEFINLLLERFRASDKDICVPVYRGQRGNPAIFSCRFYHQLFKISGDVGGREIISAHPQDVCEVEVNDPHVFTDIDKPADLEKLKASAGVNLPK